MPADRLQPVTFNKYAVVRDGMGRTRLYFNLDMTLTEMEQTFDDVTVAALKQVDVAEEAIDATAYYTDYFQNRFDRMAENPRENAFAEYFVDRGIDADPTEAASLYEQLELAAVQPVDRLRPVLEQLQTEYDLGVLTAGTVPLQQQKIEKLGIGDLLTSVLATYTEDVPKVDLFDIAEERYSADRYIYFSHRESDIEKAADAGWDTVHADFSALYGDPVETVKNAIDGK